MIKEHRIAIVMLCSLIALTLLISVPDITRAEEFSSGQENISMGGFWNGPRFRNLRRDWDVRLGIGVITGPAYEGSDEYDVRAMPMLSVAWRNRLSLAHGGLQYTLRKTRDLTINLSAGFRRGRHENRSSALIGLGETGKSFILGAGTIMKKGLFSMSAKVSQAVGGSVGGTLITLGATFRMPMGSRRGGHGQHPGRQHSGGPGDKPGSHFKLPFAGSLFISLGPTVTWASDEYMDAFFGIDSIQAARSVYDRYDPEGGFKDVGFSIMLGRPLDEKRTIMLRLGVKKLLGDAADSPIVKDDTGYSAMLGLNCVL